MAVSANAQFHFGGSFSINFSNERTSFTSSGVSIDKEHAYLINLKPKFHWDLNEKMQVGGRIGFAFGKLTTGMIYDSNKKEDIEIVNRAVDWSGNSSRKTISSGRSYNKSAAAVPFPWQVDSFPQ